MIPCKECLVKAICRQKIRSNLQSLMDLDCDLVEDWVAFSKTDALDRLTLAYKELGVEDF